MTARDQVIRAMQDRERAHGQEPWGRSYYSDLLDGIPPDVLARLAIEQGGLVEVGIGSRTRGPVTSLYRLADSSGQPTVSAADSTKADGAPSP